MNRIEKIVLAAMFALPLAFLAFGESGAWAREHEHEEEESEGYESQLAVPMAAGKAGATSAATAKADATATAWREECGGCHIPYPPKLLPASSWRTMMGSLDQHFGTDATLADAQVTKQVTDFLVAHAGAEGRMTGKKGEASPQRITETRWFVREHDEVRADVWKRPSIKSPANCGACHQGAADGNFNEHRIRIPKQ